jgi:predicted enzyme related to lactoylglutathione lyase
VGLIFHWSDARKIHNTFISMGQQGYTQGDFGWSELNTTNAADAMNFYSALVGWEQRGEPMPGYHVFGRNGEMLGGISNVQCSNGEAKTPRWMPYITVDDIDATLAKVEGLGGTVLMPPCEIPNDGGRIAIIQDPQGVATGLAQYKKCD